MMKYLRDIMMYFLLAVVAIFLVNTLSGNAQRQIELAYSEFRTQVANGQITEVEIEQATGRIVGTRKEGDRFMVNGPRDDINALADELSKAGVTVKIKPESNSFFLSLLPILLPLIVIGVLWYVFFNQMQSNNNRAMSFGKSRARLHSEDKTKVTFEDVAGEDEAKEELQEVVEFLKQPKRFTELGAKIPKGVLLVGAPGTGKTLLARAAAGEAGVPFFSISGSDFVEMFVGIGAARVRDMFEQAKKNAPCIIFIDEIDAVGRQRGAGLGGGHDEREQTLNQLLVEMDGFELNSGIVILAATNRPDVLDPALLRPGRFDRQVVVNVPDLEGREAILKVHAKGKILSDDVDLRVIARGTPGFTGADLANVLNEAALLAARRNKKKITMDETQEAVERVIAGPQRKSKIILPQERNITAYHEAGHALVHHYLGKTPVHKVSILPRGMAAGYTIALPEEEKHFMTRSDIQDEVAALLGGRAAEELALKEISTGAENDLDRATKLVRKMITEYGMSDELGHMTFGQQHDEQIFLGRDISRARNYSEEVAAMIDREMRKTMDTCYDRAISILSEHRNKLDQVVEQLKEKEVLGSEDFKAILNGALLINSAPADPQ
ncbi:MAG TPA: cell division protein FtsH [Firmicutes bacterium]|nr:cell division protein FtsH [Bacillota bacterium]HAZ22784.1 cell division protein FtsH [Bacillota bacterium]HBG43984.1 cell division protein FtsH [Bacillota bacterium]HBL50891.1 cell division protein FtsH [Bacillota bacterium]HBL67643.1 cell division protein FtsH [Bacillota bacterium]